MSWISKCNAAGFRCVKIKNEVRRSNALTSRDGTLLYWTIIHRTCQFINAFVMLKNCRLCPALILASLRHTCTYNLRNMPVKLQQNWKHTDKKAAFQPAHLKAPHSIFKLHLCKLIQWNILLREAPSSLPTDLHSPPLGLIRYGKVENGNSQSQYAK